ncbi:hypothetical protein [Weissella minor]|uniref:hypothetical protein n=1 Tax=Weissella minor TaxID=1620 RepID=UPI003AF26137
MLVTLFLIILIVVLFVVSNKILSYLTVKNLKTTEKLMQLKLSAALIESESAELQEVGKKLFNDAD